MYQTKHRSFTLFFALLLFVVGNVSANSSYYEFDEFDDIPEVTDRVARIGAISGDVLIKRLDSDDWEDARLNLPLVEGDQLATAPGGLVEVQFRSNKHLWISGSSIVKFTTLRDEGIAVSLSQGSLTARALTFDLETEFFEIDAPKTTIALQQSGQYRVDAGKVGSADVRVTIEEGGMARIYSESAGFSLRDGRTARVFIDGNLAGEWQLADSAQFTDDFDRWVAERIGVITDRLQNAHFDEYYDDSIVGAEELTNYGDWVHTTEYGYMWRPSSSSIRTYSNWSPYQYGEWRWIPPYGWTWVNDEPWGWATYHYGRWVWHNNFWYWSPYGYQRYGRSVWRPALVIMSYWGSSIYWYPLPYYYGYYNYNYYYHRNRRHNRPNRPNRPQPTPTPFTGSRSPVAASPGNSNLPPGHTGSRLPSGSVMIMDKKDFGKVDGSVITSPPDVTRQILDKKVDPVALELPTYVPANRANSGSTTARTLPAVNPNVKIGAAPRSVDTPLDPQLQKRQIFGNREPVPPAQTTQRANPPMVTNTPAETVQPRTGAVQRSPVVTQPNVLPQRQVVTRPNINQQTTKTETPAATQPTVLPQRQVVTRPNTPQNTPTQQQRSTSPTTTPAPARPTTPPPARSTPSPSNTQSRPSEPARNSSPPPQRSSPPPQRSSPPAQRSTPAPQRSSPPASRPTESRPSPTPSSSSKKDG